MLAYEGDDIADAGGGAGAEVVGVAWLGAVEEQPECAGCVGGVGEVAACFLVADCDDWFLVACFDHCHLLAEGLDRAAIALVWANVVE